MSAFTCAPWRPASWAANKYKKNPGSRQSEASIGHSTLTQGERNAEHFQPSHPAIRDSVNHAWISEQPRNPELQAVTQPEAHE